MTQLTFCGYLYKYPVEYLFKCVANVNEYLLAVCLEAVEYNWIQCYYEIDLYTIISLTPSTLLLYLVLYGEFRVE